MCFCDRRTAFFTILGLEIFAKAPLSILVWWVPGTSEDTLIVFLSSEMCCAVARPPFFLSILITQMTRHWRCPLLQLAGQTLVAAQCRHVQTLLSPRLRISHTLRHRFYKISQKIEKLAPIKKFSF